jgi:hypothetical protein
LYCLLALALVFLARGTGLYVAVPAGLVGMVACEVGVRNARKKGDTSEPWRFDGYCLALATLAILSLALTVGPDATPLGWMLAALLVALGVASVHPDAA